MSNPVVTDAHLHLGDRSSGFEERMWLDLCCGARDRVNAPNDPGSIVAEMNRTGVHRACLLAFDTRPRTGTVVTNESVLAATEAYPTRFVPYLSAPAEPEGVAECVRLIRCRPEVGGVKLAPAYAGVSPADPVWDPIYELCARRRIPALVHLGFTPSTEASPRFVAPMLLEEAVARWPGTLFQVAHVGNPWTSVTIDLMARHENVWADLSIFLAFRSVPEISSVIKAALDREVADRLLFGSDWPFGPITESLDHLHQALDELGTAVTEDVRVGLLGDNIFRLLNQKGS